MTPRLDDLPLLDLSEVAAAIAEGRTTAVAATEACLARIEAWQPALNCFIAIDREGALAAAAARDAELARGYRRGPLHGVPLAHKDMFLRKGRVSTGGSLILRDAVAATTSTLMERLDGAGAVEVGRLNMSEFAAGPTGHNVHYGHCRNAFDRAHIAGGSSSGSGAAVAARLVYGALGSDTGASVRLPAAANGVVGLKPTYGRVTRHGAIARSWSLDHVGPIARTARDCALLLQVIAGPDPRDPTTSHRPVGDLLAPMEDTSLAGIRIGVPGDAIAGAIDPEVASALEASLRVLEKLGAGVRVVPLPDLTALFHVAETIIKCEAAAMHRPWLEARPQDYGKHVRLRIEAGFHIPATQYIDALRLRATMTERFLAETMAEVDLLHLPVLPIPVPTLEETDVDGAGGEAVVAVVGRITAFTRPFNLLGLPAVSVPCGFCRKGLPIAYQLVGRPFAEALLLRVVNAYQQATDHHRKVPVL
ncbi:MAG TPA: amidase [Thermodesulfobacteriota bacterium]